MAIELMGYLASTFSVEHCPQYFAGLMFEIWNFKKSKGNNQEPFKKHVLLEGRVGRITLKLTKLKRGRRSKQNKHMLGKKKDKHNSFLVPISGLLVSWLVQLRFSTYLIHSNYKNEMRCKLRWILFCPSKKTCSYGNYFFRISIPQIPYFRH